MLMPEIDPLFALLEPLILRKYDRRKGFYDAIGVSSQAFNNWRTRGIPASKIVDVATALGLDPTALARGRAEPANAVLDYRAKYLGSKPDTYPGPDTQGLVPVISWVRAGSWDEAEDNYHVGDGEE